MFHDTNQEGFNGIRAQSVWTFRASQPPGGHPRGADFTTLPPGTRNLNKRLFIRGCADKTRFVLGFRGGDDLQRLPGGRGEVIRSSSTDYDVDRSRRQVHGETAQVAESAQ